jgi:hypothetical protein
MSTRFANCEHAKPSPEKQRRPNANPEAPL